MVLYRWRSLLMRWDPYLAALHSQQVASRIRPDALLRFSIPLRTHVALCGVRAGLCDQVPMFPLQTRGCRTDTPRPTGFVVLADVLLKLGRTLPALCDCALSAGGARGDACSPRSRSCIVYGALVCMVHPI